MTQLFDLNAINTLNDMELSQKLQIFHLSWHRNLFKNILFGRSQYKYITMCSSVC